MSVFNSGGSPLAGIGLNCIKYERLEITDTAQFLQPPTGAKSALISAEEITPITGNILLRFREDGEEATNTNGMPLTNLGIYEIRKGSLLLKNDGSGDCKFSVITAETTPQVLHIQYFR